MKALRGCLMTPLPIHLAPLGVSRYDHITWYPPKVVRCHHKHLDGLWEKSITRASTHEFLTHQRHASFEKYIGKQIPYLLNWWSKISQCSLCKFMQYILKYIPFSIAGYPSVPKNHVCKEGFPSHHNKIPQGNCCLPRHKLSTSTPSLATWGLGQLEPMASSQQLLRAT